jgi:hypothetical protein
MHSSLASLKRTLGILSPIVQPAASFLLLGTVDFLHRRTLESLLVGHQYISAAVALG